MKKKLFAIFLALTMIFSLTGCGTDSSVDVAALEEKIDALTQQVETLSGRLDTLEQKSGLQSWALIPTAWSNGGGASVRLTAVPVTYADGQSASFSVRLNNQEIINTPCTWDGTSYTATVELEAADGYSYFCSLSAADGTREQFALNTPENPVDDTLVYLRTSLVAYGNLVVESWYTGDNKLNITSGYVQVQMPQIAAESGHIVYSDASLVLQLNGQEVSRLALDLPEGEGAGSYELVINDASFDMPEMADADQLELWLEVTLSSGEQVLSSGGSWFYSDGELLLAVG